MYTIKMKSKVQEFANYDVACAYLESLSKHNSRNVELSDSFMPEGYKLVNGKLQPKVKVIPLHRSNFRKLIYTTANV